MKGGFFVVLLIVLCGCREIQDYKIDYKGNNKKYTVEEMDLKSNEWEKITGSFSGFPIAEMWRILPDKLSYAYDFDLADKVISMEVVDVTVDEFFTLVSRQLGVDFVVDGGVYYLGKVDINSYSCYIGRFNSLEQSNLEKVINSCRSNDGKFSFIGSGVFVFTDRWFSVQRLHRVLQVASKIKLLNFSCRVWLVNDSKLREMYVKANSTAKYTLDWVAGSTMSYSHWSTILSGVVDASLDYSQNRYVRQFAAVLRDGESYTYTNGENVPVLKKTVSDQGTVTTTGVEYVNVGTKLECKLSRFDDERCNLDLSAEVSSGEREVEGYPVKVSSVYSTKCLVGFGDVVVVGKYDTDNESNHILGYRKEKISYWIVVCVELI